MASEVGAGGEAEAVEESSSRSDRHWRHGDLDFFEYLTVPLCVARDGESDGAVKESF